MIMEQRFVQVGVVKMRFSFGVIKTKLMRDRKMSRSKYMPHQGKQEIARRLAKS